LPLQPGARLGPYEILSLLGVGGMGEVYRARDTKLKRDVALKVLPDAFAQDAERMARFEREAQLLAALNHPNIAAIYGLEESGGVRALVMELVEGPTLAERLTGVGRALSGPPAQPDLIRSGLPVTETLAIARQIADAFEAAHEQGIMHRDLKPANIKVRPDGMVKVLDFGLAKALDPVAQGFSPAIATNSPTITNPAMMTGAGVILGTAAYMAPEQARGKAVDKRADIWAFGCVLYEMLNWLTRPSLETPRACGGNSSGVLEAGPAIDGSDRERRVHFLARPPPAFPFDRAVFSRAFSKISRTAKSRGRRAAFLLLTISASEATRIPTASISMVTARARTPSKDRTP